MEEYVEWNKKTKTMITRFINQSRKFCDRHCVPDGLNDILLFAKSGEIPEDIKYSKKISYDYDYFAFTKSTKSLLALRHLLNDKDYHFNEEAFMLIRSIFENHIISRYVREHIDIEIERKSVVEKFVINPMSVTFDYYSLVGNKIIDDLGADKGIIPMPNKYKMAEDAKYYSELYQFLCEYTHCSFGALTCYFDEHLFTYSKDNFELLTKLLTIFVFTKVYEGVVTVNYEDLGSERDEKGYYDLAYDSLELQIELADYLIERYKNKSKTNINLIIEKYVGVGEYDSSYSKVVKMLILMKESLFDSEIGSLKKGDYKSNEGFLRYYHNNDARV